LPRSAFPEAALFAARCRSHMKPESCVLFQIGLQVDELFEAAVQA
jgi:hypothetical protein